MTDALAPGRPESGRVLIVTAMSEEAHRLSAAMQAATSTALSGVEAWHGRIADHQVDVVVTGIGKVASALAVQHAIDTYRADWLLVTGIAGAAGEDVPVGAVVVPRQAVQWDVDARPLADRPGLIPGLRSEYFAADETLLDVATRACGISSDAPLYGGTVLTGDSVIASAALRDRLRDRYPDATCVDMESAAAAHVAAANGVPWVAIRVVSDLADDDLDVGSILRYTADRAAAELAAIAVQTVSLMEGASRSPT